MVERLTRVMSATGSAKRTVGRLLVPTVPLVPIRSDEIVAVADGVAARRRSSKRIMLSFDEWNVWYRTRDRATRTKPGWPEAPAILEEIYTMEDALVFGDALLTLINRSNRVKPLAWLQGGGRGGNRSSIRPNILLVGLWERSLTCA